MILSKKLYARLIICFFCFIFLFGNENIEANASNLVNQKITIASEPDYPPYCFVNAEGKAAGFSVDLFCEAAKVVDLDVEIKIGIWSKIKQDLAEGNIDALPLVGRTPERESTYDFSMKYLTLNMTVFVKKGTKDINNPQDLKNKHILVMKGDNAEEYVRRHALSDHITTTNTYEEAFHELLAGKYDAVVAQRIMGIQLLKSMSIKKIIPLDFSLPDAQQNFCFAVQKGNTDLLAKLDEGLSIIIANDTYEAVRYKWFGPQNLNEGEILRKILWNLLLILIPTMVLLAIGVIIFLRKRIKIQTQHLNNEIDEHKITNEKLLESEFQLRLILNSTAEGIYGIDNRGICIFCNASGLKLLGYNDKSQVIGKNLHDSLHHATHEGATCTQENCSILQTLSTGKNISQKSEVFWRTDKTNFYAEYSVQVTKNKNNITGAVITFQDVSEKWQAREDLKKLANTLEKQVKDRTSELAEKLQSLNKSQKAMLYMIEDLNQITSELKAKSTQLELSNAELEAFTYSVSHDLRAPLRAIDGFSSFLIEDYYDQFDEEGKRLIDVIRANTKKMDQLITDLLNLSRISGSELNFSKVNMQNMVRDIFFETATEDQKNTFTIKIKELPPAFADPRLIRQVWQNLFENALKYSSQSQHKYIEIGAKNDETTIRYYIKDKGAGFNPKYTDKLFGVFQRLHNEEEFEGNGIGLAIVKRIIAHHGGEVFATGKPDQGAIFHFSLPKMNKKEGVSL